MNHIEREFLEKLLYKYTKEEVKTHLINLDENLIHTYVFNYNWDNGLDIPNIIINNSKCSLSTALLIFYNCDGIRYLLKETMNQNTSWCVFINSLYNNIINDVYKNTNISFAAPLTQVEIFKLKKILSDKEHIFINKISGKNLCNII